MKESVRLQFSLASDLLILVKLVSAAVATKAGLDIDEMEDFRLASYELCVSAIGERSSGMAEVIFEFSQSEITCSCTITDDDALNPEQSNASGTSSDLSRQIIDALVDDFRFANEAGRSFAWLSMRLDALA